MKKNFRKVAVLPTKLVLCYLEAGPVCRDSDESMSPQDCLRVVP